MTHLFPNYVAINAFFFLATDVLFDRILFTNGLATVFVVVVFFLRVVAI